MVHILILVAAVVDLADSVDTLDAVVEERLLHILQTMVEIAELTLQRRAHGIERVTDLGICLGDVEHTGDVWAAACGAGAHWNDCDLHKRHAKTSFEFDTQRRTVIVQRIKPSVICVFAMAMPLFFAIIVCSS